MTVIQAQRLTVVCYTWPEKAVATGFVREKGARPAAELLTIKRVVFPSTVLEMADNGAATC